MDHKFPVYTALAQCQDCYKCVRECPVKAIQIENNLANVLPEYCVGCGHCVEVCPVGAKHIRDDVNRLRYLLKSTPVFVSLAPSWVSEFPDVSLEDMAAALGELGFAGVSETALGAEVVSGELMKDMPNWENKLYISSACPAVVEWVKKYTPGLSDNITSLYSPLLAHCKMIKQNYGDEYKVVFFGPCAAKKIEADRNPELLNLALTFADLNSLLTEAGIALGSGSSHHKEVHIFGKAREGMFYPLEGGMIRTLEKNNVENISISGLDNIIRELEGLTKTNIDKPVFLEALACAGGCINGPGTICPQKAGISKRLSVIKNVEILTEQKTGNKAVDLDIKTHYGREYVSAPVFTDQKIQTVLVSLNKHSQQDELNCGGCGYETCREFAAAMLQGKAESEMCVSYMRIKAQRKANALLRSMPSGVVIVNRKLEIIECNRPFAEMFDDDTRVTFDALDNLENAKLNSIVPFGDLFRLVLHTGDDICRERYDCDGRIFNLTIFSIQKNETVGAVIQDVTEVQWQRQQIARKAREVLRKNLATVQNIASSLGEHMADTEILLNSIAYSYEDDQPDPEREQL